MTILAFDPGETIGYAVLNENASLPLVVLNSGTIKWSKDKGKKISKLLAQYKPRYVAFEETGGFLNPIYKHIIEEACKTFEIPTMACDVQIVREALYGNAFASKSQTIELLKAKMILLKHNISKHELDSISIGLHALGIKLV